MDAKRKVKPAVIPFYMLAYAMRSLHHWNKADVARLHDIWLLGAPSPDSIIKAPGLYDPRKQDKVNYEARLILAKPLTNWILDVASRRGIEITAGEAGRLIAGLNKAFTGVSRNGNR